MSGLLSRSVVLTASRLSNFVIQLFSPLLLVRLLDVPSYGQYQEFMIYAAVITTLCSLAVDSSLTYFLPRNPGNEQRFVSQTTLVTLGICTPVLLALFFSKPLILRIASYDFVVPLVLYVFFFVNLAWVEYYWIAKRRPDLVLYYSALRLVVRVSVLLLVAHATGDVTLVIWSAVIVEAARALWVLIHFARRGMFVGDLRRDEIAEQLRFAVPVGAAAVVQNMGRSIGKIIIGSTLGPTVLAYYAVGSYLQPIIRVMRSGINDAVYPELVRAHDKPDGALLLWQRVNVLNCVLFFPLFVLVTYYAEEIIRVLFTRDYLAAVPIFHIYAFFLLRRCFNTDVLLRTTGQTAFMFWGTVGALALNVVLIVLLSPSLGMIGPAIAFIAAEVGLEFYYAWRARRRLGVSTAQLADWRNIIRIAAACMLAFPVLLLFSVIPGPELVRIALASILYSTGVLALAYRLGVSDVGRVVGYIWLRLRRATSR